MAVSRDGGLGRLPGSNEVTAPAGPAMIRAYLQRIGFDGEPAPDLTTLAGIHRRHVEAVAWNNLDAFTGRRTTRDPADAFDKIVRRGRGGWCFEMNGLFAWMLESVGFRVTRLAAGVMRESLGDDALGNHLALLVHLDETWLADVGLGAGMVEPVPLAAGTYRQRFLTFRLERLGGSWWRFRNHPGAMPPSFDFSTGLSDEALLDARCEWLQTDPASPFVRNLVVQRHFPDRLESLAGAQWSRIGSRGSRSGEIADSRDYRRRLRVLLGAAADEAAALWAKVRAQPVSFA